MAVEIPIDCEAIADFCRRHHIRRLALFSSVTRDDFRDDSDVDVLVDFEPEHTPGLLRLTGMEIELSEIVGRRVDMRTAEDLGHRFHDRVVESAYPLYASC